MASLAWSLTCMRKTLNRDQFQGGSLAGVFAKFIRLTGLTRRNPTANVLFRKIPVRVLLVPSLEDIEKLIAACEKLFRAGRG